MLSITAIIDQQLTFIKSFVMQVSMVGKQWPCFTDTMEQEENERSLR